MAGNSDYMAQATLDFITGRAPMPAIAGRWLALFTTAPTADAGTGGTEVSGGAYARVQVAGTVTASTSITNGVTTTITVNTGQTWIVPGMNVFDLTNAPANGQIGTVLTYVTGTGVITLVAAASHGGTGSTDSIEVSAWPASSASSGNEPATLPANVTNGSVITFAQATLSWGTVLAWGLYDAVTSGNLIFWDWLGNNKWIPFNGSSASPSVLTTDLAADVPANGTFCVVTAKFGGATLPTTAGSWAGPLTSAGSSGITFNLGVNSSTTGGGLFRQITEQSIPANVTASFAASTFTISQA
jgi:hypothetical protein